MQQQENWRVIVRDPKYLVLDLGRVMNRKRGNMLTPSSNNSGDYFRVGLSSNGIETKELVAILVAEAFLENPEHLPQVDHKDNNKANNKVSNLRYCTISQNQANRSGWGKSNTKGVSWSKKSSKWYAQIQVANRKYNLGHYDSEAEASCVYDWFALLLYKEFAKLNTKFKRNYPPELLEKIFALMERHNF